jgi:hypothetical protein
VLVRHVATALAVTAAVVGCVSSDHYFPSASVDASGAWASCGLPAVAPVHRDMLGRDAGRDPSTDTCAVTVWSWTATECRVATIALDDTTKCAANDCCRLRHESEHIAQFHAACTLCASDPDGRSFDDCMSCYEEFCEPEQEAVAYHVNCATLSTCGPGGDARNGSGPPVDAPLDLGSDVDAVCYSEWDACKRALAADRPLPAECRGTRPACEKIVDVTKLACGCGTPADRVFGCALACPNGGRCIGSASSGCQCVGP